MCWVFSDKYDMSYSQENLSVYMKLVYIRSRGGNWGRSVLFCFLLIIVIEQSGRWIGPWLAISSCWSEPPKAGWIVEKRVLFSSRFWVLNTSTLSFQPVMRATLVASQHSRDAERTECVKWLCFWTVPSSVANWRCVQIANWVIPAEGRASSDLTSFC